MNMVTRRLTLAQIAVTGYVSGALDRLRNDERGQGAIEYVGIAVVVVALIGAIAAVLKSDTAVGKAISDKISSLIGSLT